jgi:hypothetical protein
MPERYSEGDQAAEEARELRAARRLLGWLTFGPGLPEAPVGALPGMIGGPVAAPPGVPLAGPPQAEGGADGEGGAGGRGAVGAEP